MTQINWQKHFLLAAALFVLGSFAYWLEFKHKPEKETAEEQSKKLFTLKDVQIEKVRLTSPGKTVEITCSDIATKLCKPSDNSKWQITFPSKLRADDSNANSLLSTLSHLTPTETIDLKDEPAEKRQALLKEYGLDASSLKSTETKRVEVKTTAGEHVLYLGSSHPIGENIFCLKAENGKMDETHVFLVPNYFKSNLDRDLTYWRDKKLLAISTNEIEAFELKGPKANINGARKNGQWILHEKDGKKDGEISGDSDNIDGLISAAAFLTAKDFVSENSSDEKAKNAVKGAKATITLSLTKGKGTAKEPPAPIILALYKKKEPPKNTKDKKDQLEKVYATSSASDPLFELDTSSLNRFDKELKDLRLSKLITSMDRFDTKKLEFSGTVIGPSPLVISSSDGKWVNKAELKTEINGEKVQSLLDKLSGNYIKEFLQGSKIPTGAENGLKLTLGDEKTATKRQILFWKNGEKLYAKDLLSQRNEAFLVDNVLKDGLPWDRNFFNKKNEPAKLPASQAG
ncbi:MAG: DUF4340 domain-containing protein [Bdellovibrionota bacterium]